MANQCLSANTALEPTGKLLPYRKARGANPPAFVYGFPLDDNGVAYCGGKLRPIPPNLAGLERNKAENIQAGLTFRHLTSACSKAWPAYRVEVESGFKLGKHYTLLALAACTRPDDEFIPKGDDMRKLKEIMVENGFKEEPMWFIMHSSLKGNTTVTATEPNGKLLPYRKARGANPPAFVYGFPLDDSGVAYCGEKLRPIPPNLTGLERDKAENIQAGLTFRHLTSACSKAWPAYRVNVESGFKLGKYYTLLALAACTLPEDEFIPKGDDMKRLKEIMAENGFKEDPMWFILTSSP
ncbi:hypothetical protein FPV67DRAFT_1673566 [Lyophyllum atratum]|nr:hypothetical protein FPV67DRAFT_1673566 [Lyophyllum atratum]